MKSRNLKFTKAINEAMILSMKKERKVICLSLNTVIIPVYVIKI